MSNKYSTILPILQNLSKQVMGDDFSHGYPHILRVKKWAQRIIEEEKLRGEIDDFVLETSILLHDIGRVVGEPHAYYSAIFAEGILRWYGVDQLAINKIKNTILYHSYSYSRKNNIKPETIEAYILSDADKLDALGIIGFLRVFHYTWQHKRSLKDTLNHFYEKILNLKELMHFKYSRKKAEELTNRILQLLDMLTNELDVDYFLK
ncbi:HD domain-containing protein [Staphylothermus hellenicus]|uniref:Metal dependent phosphohydrolase n=1 Tax=Staphylothermus hellenicus (strain DSM 12710 / JCM 10830 / BK20S6-10-b1 / P8) TaxID=591019 RepID=D7DC90_STAHD|nr:HD domain-containing protein [Staphylothermus hellenicus]ADI31787.1 metal dependent phosphohydrolase [Staphylothermus hellenicus DSM 12710]